VPILGNLFRSKQFQKNESELMFIVTAQMVKPVNRDDLPAIPNVENLKNGSLLGVEPKASGAMTGPSGFIINGTSTGAATTTAPVASEPATAVPAPAAGGTKAKPEITPGPTGANQPLKGNSNP